ncbi:MAG TPA: hypothetical protein QF861_00015 [Alphaproteobacteria bacterium]|nr:hypothetical protein [Alphaproteobacteria bacterium]
MPISYELICEQRVVLTIFEGVLREADYVDHWTALGKDENYSSDFNEILDYTQLRKLDVGVHAIRRIVNNSNFNASTRRAFVTGMYVPAKKLTNAMRSIHIRRGADVEVFEILEEAQRWLGIS